MNVLILSASIGSGHTKAAQALKNVFGDAAQVVDFTAREISTLNWLTKKIYLAALKFIPDLYDRIYKFADGQRVGISARFLSSALMYLPFARLLKKFRPEIVICTHPFPESAASLWKFLHAKSARNFLLAAVLTDYSLHEIWIFGEVDAYFVATNEMAQKLSLNCRAGQKIFATGIPIGAEFAKIAKIDRKTDSSRKKILIMGGGLGLGSIEDTLADLESISTPLNVIIVAGQNEKLISRLKSLKSRHKLEIFGYISDIYRFMAAADILITKPGALTISEAFSAGLPMILHAPIPGPEFLNAKFAVSHGAAISVAENQKISSIVDDLLKNPEKLAEMRLQAKKISRPLAAVEIVRQIQSEIELNR